MYKLCLLCVAEPKKGWLDVGGNDVAWSGVEGGADGHCCVVT